MHKKKKKKINVQFFANVDIDLDEIQCAATTCWFVEVRTKVILRK